MINLLKQITIWLFTIILLTGCTTGKREINHLAIVMGVGLDQVENEEGEKQIQITAQVVRPADARGQTGSPSGQTGEPVWSITATGGSIFDAIRNLGSFSSRNIFWAHTSVIVINEDLAKEGIHDIIDFFSRNPELRMRTWVAVTPNKASELISTMTSLEVIPAESVSNLFNFSPITRAAPRTQMLDLLSAYLSVGGNPYLARLEVKPTSISNKTPEKGTTINNVTLAGTAVFKDDKMIGTLTSKETRALLLFIEDIQSGVVVLPCEDDELSFELKHDSVSVAPSYKNKKVEFDLDIQTKVRLVEAGCPVNFDNTKRVEELEKEVEKGVKADIEAMLDKVQKEFGVDILEAANTFNNKYPAEWKEIKDDWDTYFKEAKYNITIDAHLDSGVLLYPPIKPQSEE
ncbi:Ger(x)C family spore germination protein [Bacillaceae bacterium S4-13-58]